MPTPAQAAEYRALEAYSCVGHQALRSSALAEETPLAGPPPDCSPQQGHAIAISSVWSETTAADIRDVADLDVNVGEGDEVLATTAATDAASAGVDAHSVDIFSGSITSSATIPLLLGIASSKDWAEILV